MSGDVFCARNSASSADFGLFRVSSYGFYIRVFQEEKWRGYNDCRTGESFEFSSQKDFFENKEGLNGGSFDLFVRAVEAMRGQDSNPGLADKANELLRLIKDDPKAESVTVIKGGREEKKKCLTAQQKKEIREKRKAGCTEEELAKEYGVVQQRISQVTTASGSKAPEANRSQVGLRAGTDPVLAAQRIRERLGDAFADALKRAL